METVREEISPLSSPATNNPCQEMHLYPSDDGSTEPWDARPRANRSGVGRIRLDLERFGPAQTIPPFALDEAFAYCRELTNLHYENFSVVSYLAPARIRPHLCSIYAYCRWSDDLADEMDNPSQATGLLHWWRGELDRCFRGHVTHPVFIALRQTISQFDLDPQPFTNLLSAFLQDQQQTRYQSDADLLSYCQRSADPVGRLVMRLAGVSNPDTIPWSDSICTGLQLANFCQDIALDAKRGRVYWPVDRLRRWGIEPNALATDAPSHSMCQGVSEWCNEARRFLLTGLPLLEHGPVWFARSIQLFVRGGLTLLRNIEEQQGDVWTRGVTVSKAQKISLLARSAFLPRSMKIAPVDRVRMDS
jgi:squalene synthase HpnC